MIYGLVKFVIRGYRYLIIVAQDQHLVAQEEHKKRLSRGVLMNFPHHGLGTRRCQFH